MITVQLGFAVVSLIFIGNFAVCPIFRPCHSFLRFQQGYVTGAAWNVWLNDRYGLGKVSRFL